jgi:hypothetical protein
VTVYACRLKHQERWAGGLADPWFQLTADTQDELHDLAARLGLPRQGYQPGNLAGTQQMPVSWHYLVSAAERDRAIELGAHAITQREMTEIERQRAAEPGIS